MLLKIVQGPNAGAEIILAEGMTLTLGKGDTCDILLADQSLADVACELEVDSERVRLLMPGGAEERLDPFQVKFLGEMTAIAIGPEKGVWEELVWPTRGVAPAATETEAPEADTSEEPPTASAPKQKRRRGAWGCVIVILVLLLGLAVAALCYCPVVEAWAVQHGIPVEKVKPMVKTGVDVTQTKARDFYAWVMAHMGEKHVAETPPAPIDLHAMATERGLTYRENEGTPMISGNFSTRAKRLSATAAFYAAKPGVILDLSDDESLRSATAEVLDLVSEGKLKVYAATNRALELEGFSPSANDLRIVLEAIRADVPHVKEIDCARVRLGEATGVVDVTPTTQGTTAVKAARAYRDTHTRAVPKMPVVGVVTVPYPCLVLKDGSRVTEGAEFGGFIIEEICADTIRIRGPEGVFEWRP